MHRSISALADAGNNIIVDHVLEKEQWLKECVNVLRGYRVMFVKVFCPLGELESRESKRNRQKGLAEYQFGKVHVHAVYDLEVDTSILSPSECAEKIKQALEEGPRFGAFEELLEKFK